MAVRTHIWHDSEGKILAVGRPHEDAGGEVQPLAPGTGGVIEADVDKELLARLHESHAVDVQNGRLRPAT